MKINGTDIFLGAYAERCKNSSFFRQEAISVSEEKSEKMKAGIKETFHSLNQARLMGSTMSMY